MAQAITMRKCGKKNTFGPFGPLAACPPVDDPHRHVVISTGTRPESKHWPQEVPCAKAATSSWYKASCKQYGHGQDDGIPLQPPEKSRATEPIQSEDDVAVAVVDTSHMDLSFEALVGRQDCLVPVILELFFRGLQLRFDVQNPHARSKNANIAADARTPTSRKKTRKVVEHALGVSDHCVPNHGKKIPKPGGGLRASRIIARSPCQGSTLLTTRQNCSMKAAMPKNAAE